MSGIYIHIPFCKQACHYCDFHFSTSLKKKDELLKAINKELQIRRDEVNGRVETIYFGGGTPSLLSESELVGILNCIQNNFRLSEDPEITLEANPDDLSKAYLKELRSAGINRLSIGIQSFIERDLKMMNRAHDAAEAEDCLLHARSLFENISADLIYGIPDSTSEELKSNILKLLDYNIPHISAYALTVEPKTALAHFIKEGLIQDVDDELAKEQYYLLRNELHSHGFVNYELSNFGKQGYFSKNNTAYWQGKSYLGIGPSAHSYNGKTRSWNVRNNTKYIKALSENRLPIEREKLNLTDSYNEYVMTGLRTIWGVSLSKIEKEFGAVFREYLLEQARPLIKEQLLYIEKEILKVSEKGLFLTDGIAAQLFKINMK